MKLVICTIVASAVLFGLCNGLNSWIECNAVLKTGAFKVNVGQIFNSSIGWQEDATRFNCYGHHYNACVDYMESKFMRMTDDFNLTTVNVHNITLGQAFCTKFPHVTETKLQVGRSYNCHDAARGSYQVELFSGTQSKQNLECKNGKAIITGAGSDLKKQSGTIFTLVSLSLVYLTRFI